jgi:hypothetical protein
VRSTVTLGALLALLLCTAPSPELAEGPDPVVDVAAVRDRGLIDTLPIITGRDGGMSFPFAGRSYWIYGDTFFSHPDTYGEGLHSNSCSHTADLDSRDGIAGFTEETDDNGVPRPFFPHTEAERRFNLAHSWNRNQEKPRGARWAIWPMAPVVDAVRCRVLVFYTLVAAEPGDFNFHSVGHSVAVWDGTTRRVTRPVFDPGGLFPTNLFGVGEPAFGVAAVAVGDTAYIYSCDKNGLAKECRLARVPLARILERGAWEFYGVGGTWGSSLQGTAVVFFGSDIMSVFYSPAFECFLAIYAEPMSRRAMLRSAPHPAGPWSRAVCLFEAQAPAGKPGWVYDVLAHPEYARDGGRVVPLTYSRATALFRSELRLVDLELKKR